MSDLLNRLIQIDTDVTLSINGFHNAFLDSFIFFSTDRLMWIPLYVAILYVVFRNLPFKTAVLCVLCVVAAVASADMISSKLLRFSVMRMRPANLLNPISQMVYTVNGYRGGSYGFPSSHAANTFALAVFFVFVFRRFLLSSFLLLWAVFQCYTRLYLGVHYLGDVIVGAILGTALACVAYFLFARLTGIHRMAKTKHSCCIIAVGMLICFALAMYSLIGILFQR